MEMFSRTNKILIVNMVFIHEKSYMHCNTHVHPESKCRIQNIAIKKNISVFSFEIWVHNGTIGWTYEDKMKFYWYGQLMEKYAQQDKTKKKLRNSKIFKKFKKEENWQGYLANLTVS